MTNTAKTKKSLDSLHLSDIYSLMLFLLYKVQDIPEYKTVSEICYLLDGSNLNRLMTYFAGKTITFPTEEEMSVVSGALLLYQYVNIDGEQLQDALMKLDCISSKQQKDTVDLYIKLISIMKQYNIDREWISENIGGDYNDRRP